MENKYEVIISGLNEKITQDEIQKELSKYVKVKQITIVQEYQVVKAELYSIDDAMLLKNQNIKINNQQIQINIQVQQSLQDKLKSNINNNNIQQNISNDEDDNEENKLFIKGIPPYCKNNVIYDYLSYYGEIKNLVIKKHHIEDKNLGYGFVQYNDSKSIDKILEQQKIKEGSLKIPSTDISLQLEQLQNSSSYQQNNIIIESFYEYPLLKTTEEERQQKQQYIIKSLNIIKDNLLQQNIAYKININVTLNNQTNNYNGEIIFWFRTDEQEEEIFNQFKNCIFDNFIYSDGMNIPSIKFYHTTNSSKRLIFIGLKDFVNPNILITWINDKLNVKLEQKQIIFLQYNGESKIKKPQKAVIYLDTEEHSEQILDGIFKCKDKDDIFLKQHKITIYLKQSDLIHISQRVSKVKNYYNN